MTDLYDWHVNYYQEPKDQRGYCYGTYLGHREVIYVVPLLEEIMERINTGKPLISMEDSWEAYRWLDSHKVHRALETGQPISIPISNFELTINNHYFDLEGPEISIKFSQLDCHKIMKALAEQAMKDDFLYTPERPGIWDPRAIPTMQGPSKDGSGREFWPDRVRGTATYRDEHSKSNIAPDKTKSKKTNSKKSKTKKKSR